MEVQESLTSAGSGRADEEKLDFKKIMPVLVIILIDLLGLSIIVPLMPLFAPLTIIDATPRDRFRRCSHDTGPSNATARITATMRSRMMPTRCQRHHSSASEAATLKIVRGRTSMTSCCRASAT